MSTKENSEAEKIEYEEVTLRLPKPVLDYIRRVYGDPTEKLVLETVDWVRADIEAQGTKLIVELFNLEPIFKAILQQVDC